MARPKRLDSVEGAAALVKAAKTPIQPTSPLTEDARRYFDYLATSRASFDWSRGDMVLLTRVSDWFAQADRIKAELDASGLIEVNAKGTRVVNPLLSAADTLERRAMAAMRQLSLAMPMEGAAKTVTAATARKVSEIADASGSDDDFSI